LKFSRSRYGWSVQVEWEPRDLWIGAFLKRERLRRRGGPGLHVYVCPFPTILLHFVRVDPFPEQPMTPEDRATLEATE
jgi:hypothetical protein